MALRTKLPVVSHQQLATLIWHSRRYAEHEYRWKGGNGKGYARALDALGD